MQDALWRAREGGAVEALVAAGRAVKTDVFILLGINNITGDRSEKMVLDIVNGVFALANELKARLRSDCTKIHLLHVPLLPLYELRGNEGMREVAEEINRMLGTGGFLVHGWEVLMSEGGTILPPFLISHTDPHLNAEGYDVFARLLRSLILSEN